MDWVNTTCPRCGGKARRETNTMPQWAGSCWYYLAYAIGIGANPKSEIRNPKQIQSSKSKVSNFDIRTSDLKVWDRSKSDYWLTPHGVDLYVGGAEHAVLHLLYARFWHKFLYDQGLVGTKEPFYKLLNQGLILGEDGVKMSKSQGNVINPDDVVKEYGADTLRMYEMFMGPFQDSKPWSTKGIIGIRRFLEKVWRLGEKITPPAPSYNKRGLGGVNSLERLLHKTIKKVSEDI